MDVVLVTASYDHLIKFWNVVDATCLQSIQHNESNVNRLAISMDKKLLAIAGNPCIRLYDCQSTQQPLRILEGHKSNVTAVGWQWEGRWLWSASEDGSVKVWDVRSSSPALQVNLSVKCQRDFPSKYPLNDACLSPDQTKIATVDERGCLRVWEVGLKECLFEWLLQSESEALHVPLQSVAFSPDGAELSCASSNGCVYVFREAEGRYVLARTINAHSAYLTRILYSPDSSVLCSCSSDCTAVLHPVDDTALVSRRALTGHSKWVWDCAFSADSAYVLTASSDGSARLWDSQSGDMVSVYTGHSKAVTCISLNDIP